MMTHYLLDTCAWLDLHLAPELLSKTARQIISTSSPLHLASMSMVEITRKVSIGKLTLAIPIDQWLTQATQSKFIKILNISEKIAIEAYALPGKFHADPADRLIVSTARIHDLTLITSDKRILDYPHVHTLSSRS